MNPLFSNNGFPNMGNTMNMMKQFNQFRKDFKGDPMQAVMNMASNGQISKSQFNQVYQTVKQFGQFFR